MASLFDPLSIALETVKTIEGVGSHRPDPQRFKIRVPINPGEWAKIEAFQRQHDLRKWSMYHAKIVIRAEKKSLKLPKIISTISRASESIEEEPAQPQPPEFKVVKISQDVEEFFGGQHREEEEEDYDMVSYDEEEDQEDQKIARMTSNQRRYYKACSIFQVTVNRKVLRCIDTFEMVLSMMKMSDPEFKAIMSALVTNDVVERLDLTELRLSDQQMVYLTDLFSEDNSISDLVLANNNLRGRVMQNFLITISLKDHLVYLDISGNDLRDKDAQTLADYVKNSESLLYLYMSRNNFTERSGEIFGKMMGDNASLIDLNISSNRLRCSGADKFLKGFSRNSNLQKLDFSWNGLGPEGVLAAVNMLKKNSTLICLNLAGSRISGADLELFYPALKKNTTLKRLGLSHNPLMMSDITGFLKELYRWTTSSLQRIDFGSYQTIEKAAVPIIDLLFWERNIDIRYGGTLTHSKDVYKCEEIISKFRDDPLALVSRLKADERMKLVRHFGQIDLNTAIEEGEEEIGVETFLYKVRNNKVTYRDLANRVKKTGAHPYDVIRSVIDISEIASSPMQQVTRYSLDPEVARRIYIKARAEEKFA